MLIAHRGGSGLRPENTLAAFEHAVAAGCDGAELDVHLSADGVLVVHHNACLNHHFTRDARGHWLTTDDEQSLATLPLAELQAYDVGRPHPEACYGGRFPELVPVDGQNIPTLAQVIERVQALSDTFKLVIEIKTPWKYEADRTAWRPLVDQVLTEVEQLGFTKRTILCGFDWRPLRYARQLEPAIPIWLTTAPFAWRDGDAAVPTDLPIDPEEQEHLRAADAAGACWYDGFRPASAEDAPRAVQDAGGDLWFAYYMDCTEQALANARELGVRVGAWAVNLRHSAKRRQLAQAGLDAVCVDYFYSQEDNGHVDARVGNKNVSLDLDLRSQAGKHALAPVGRRRSVVGYMRDVWRIRAFAFELARSRIQARNQENRLGMAWVVLTPLLDALVYGTVFGVLQGSKRPDHFIQFLLVGIFFFRFFTNCVSQGAKCIISNRSLVQSLSFPRMVLPLATILESFLDFLPVLGVLLVINVIMGSWPQWQWLYLVPVVAVTVLFHAGLVLFMARLAVHFRDITQIVPFGTRFMRYFSGVFYDPTKFVAGMPSLLVFFTFDPLYDYMEMARAVLIPGYSVSMTVVLSGLVWALAGFVLASLFFWQAEEQYGRVI